MYRRAATYVDKILKGARPSDLPVEQPSMLELVINLKTAKSLGLTINREFLLRADELIDRTARVCLWQILLRKSLAAFMRSDSVRLIRFATEAIDDGRLNHDQRQFFYSFSLEEAVPGRARLRARSSTRRWRRWPGHRGRGLGQPALDQVRSANQAASNQPVGGARTRPTTTRVNVIVSSSRRRCRVVGWRASPGTPGTA